MCVLLGEARGLGLAEQVACFLTAGATSCHMLLMCLAELLACMGGITGFPPA